jgi:hypothetical protein
MHESSKRVEAPTYEDVQTALCVAFQGGYTGEKLKTHSAYTKLSQYIEAKEAEIDVAENNAEMVRGYIELTFQKGMLFTEAGFIKEGKRELLAALHGASEIKSEDQYQRIYNYFIQNGGTEGEIVPEN